jgi:nucleotide-binding universal stress UspA family protein
MEIDQPEKTKQILLAVDGSEHSWAAVKLLSDLPLCTSAPAVGPRSWLTKLTILTVLLPREAAFYNQRRTALENAADHLAKRGLEAETELITGYPAEALNNYASEAEPYLFVMGAKGLRSSLEILLGGVAQQIVEYASWPVLVVRSSYKGLKTILLANDGSAFSQAAVDYLCAFPLPPDVVVKVVHVLPPVYSPELIAQRYPAMPEALIPFPSIDLPDFETSVEEEEQEGQVLLDRAVEQLRRQNIQAESRMLRGDAATEILEFARQNQVDLVVTGSRGLSPVKRFLLGSVSRKLVHYASTSVLVVKK